MTLLLAGSSDPAPAAPAETEEMETEENQDQTNSSKPNSRSVTPCSDVMKGSPASGTSKGSLKREHEEEDDCESELEIADGDGRNVFKNAGKLIDGAVTNSDFEVRGVWWFSWGRAGLIGCASLSFFVPCSDLCFVERI